MGVRVRSDIAADTKELKDRLQAVVGARSCEEMGRRTGISGESVRRYLRGHPPSARFLAALCNTEMVSGTWLLTGRGSMRAAAEGPSVDDAGPQISEGDR